MNAGAPVWGSRHGAGPLARSGARRRPVLSKLYSSLAAKRRRWYERRPELRRRLAQPVVSVGALTVGGSGKTPVVAKLAELLLTLGERPSVLSRGYRRTRPVDGVVVVRNCDEITADLETAGDEPLMLARHLTGVSVLVAEDRYVAGRLAETRLGATVHLLDDGFQYLSLNRDVELLIVGEADADEHQTLPGGRLREPVETAHLADALLVETGSATVAGQVARRLTVAEVFRFTRRLQPPRLANPGADRMAKITAGARTLAVAGIARPERFVAGLRRSGYVVADTVKVRDHHAFSAQDIDDICRRAESIGADWILTTEKDMVRLLPHAPFGFPLAFVPITIEIEPAGRWRAWLAERLSMARTGGRLSQTGCD